MCCYVMAWAMGIGRMWTNVESLQECVVLQAPHSTKVTSVILSACMYFCVKAIESVPFDIEEDKT